MLLRVLEYFFPVESVASTTIGKVTPLLDVPTQKPYFCLAKLIQLLPESTRIKVIALTVLETWKANHHLLDPSLIANLAACVVSTIFVQGTKSQLIFTLLGEIPVMSFQAGVEKSKLPERHSGH